MHEGRLSLVNRSPLLDAAEGNCLLVRQRAEALHWTLVGSIEIQIRPFFLDLLHRNQQKVSIESIQPTTIQTERS